jgi:hypothetical protein
LSEVHTTSFRRRLAARFFGRSELCERTRTDESIGELLDSAEEIVNAIASDVLAEVEAEKHKKTGRLPRLSKKARAKNRKKKKKR